MPTEAKDEFKRVKSIEELESLTGELIQIHYPEPDDYIIGYLKKAEKSKKIDDIEMYLSSFVRRKGKSIPISLYKNLPKHPKVFIPRVLRRGIEYMIMKEE